MAPRAAKGDGNCGHPECIESSARAFDSQNVHEYTHDLSKTRKFSAGTCDHGVGKSIRAGEGSAPTSSQFGRFSGIGVRSYGSSWLEE